MLSILQFEKRHSLLAEDILSGIGHFISQRNKIQIKFGKQMLLFSHVIVTKLEPAGDVAKNEIWDA